MSTNISPYPIQSNAECSRLLVVSNRLPITIKKQDKNNSKWNITMSSGGLVAALSGLKKLMEFTWIGWPGFEISEQEQNSISETLMSEYFCMPVFLPERLSDMYYNGFSNGILWPLLHYLPGDIDFDDTYWTAYQEANEYFANAILKVIKEGDLVWIQDYHLFLLPSLLRQKFPNVKIGFFLHTPFPSSEIFRVLPVAKQILYGVVQSDLIGFHTYDYARHFSSSCTRILGLNTVPNGVELLDQGCRLAHLGTFPIGIDSEQFTNGLSKPEILQHIQYLKRKFNGKKIIIGVDRLDYIKGVPHKLYALELFFSNHPEFQNQVVLIQVAVPSRVDVKEYQHLISTVNELVGRINGKYGTLDFMPIHYINKSVNFEELVSLYAVADVCLVSSTRDGMNLVSYEYIACQQDNHGVLILSEFAGAAQSLNGAIIVNPWNTDELSEAIYEALTMPKDVRKKNHQSLYRYITKYSAANWGMSFMSELGKIAAESSLRTSSIKLSPSILRDQLFKDDAKYIILFIDIDSYDIKELKARSNVLIYLVSGDTRSKMEQCIASHSNEHFGLVAEYGSFYKHSAYWRPLLPEPITSVHHLLLSTSTVNDDMSKSIHIETRRLYDNDNPYSLALNSDLSLPSTSSNGESSTSQPTRTASEYDIQNWIPCVDQMIHGENWKDPIRTLFQYYTDRTPGSYIDEKEVILGWNYSKCDETFGSWQASELKVNLEKIIGHMPVKMSPGCGYIELYPTSLEKSITIHAILKDVSSLLYQEKDPIIRVLYIGQDCMSESFFSSVKNSSNERVSVHASPQVMLKLDQEEEQERFVNIQYMTCTIGHKETDAEYYLDSLNDLVLA